MNPRYERWRKSSHSAPDGDCVEVGRSLLGMIAVRDTKEDGAGVVLELTRTEWASFLREVRDS